MLPVTGRNVFNLACVIKAAFRSLSCLSQLELTLNDQVFTFARMIIPISKIQLHQDEDGVWIAKSSLLPGCHAHGKNRGEATLHFQLAAKAHLEVLLETGRPIPPAFRDGFVLVD